MRRNAWFLLPLLLIVVGGGCRSRTRADAGARPETPRTKRAPRPADRAHLLPPPGHPAPPEAPTTCSALLTDDEARTFGAARAEATICSAHQKDLRLLDASGTLLGRVEIVASGRAGYDAALAAARARPATTVTEDAGGDDPGYRAESATQLELGRRHGEHVLRVELLGPPDEPATARGARGQKLLELLAPRLP